MTYYSILGRTPANSTSGFTPPAIGRARASRSCGILRRQDCRPTAALAKITSCSLRRAHRAATSAPSKLWSRRRRTLHRQLPTAILSSLPGPRLVETAVTWQARVHASPRTAASKAAAVAAGGTSANMTMGKSWSAVKTTSVDAVPSGRLKFRISTMSAAQASMVSSGLEDCGSTSALPVQFRRRGQGYRILPTPFEKNQADDARAVRLNPFVPAVLTSDALDAQILI